MKKYTSSVIASLFIVSLSLIALQLFYMRTLSVIRYHHFSYLVISTALLGFGASGTYLTCAFKRIEKHFNASAERVLLAFSISIPVSYSFVKLLPIDIRYLLYSPEQVLLLALYNLLVLVPFFFGALFIGACLRYYREAIPVLYGVNLFASGLGGLGALWVMQVIPAEILPLVPAVAGVVAQFAWAVGSTQAQRSAETQADTKAGPQAETKTGSQNSAGNSAGDSAGEPNRGRRKSFKAAVAGLLIAVAGFTVPVESGIDQYKSLAHIRRLEQQGDAEHIFTDYSPRMRLDVYEVPSLHQTLFAGPTAQEAPPPQLSILFDGEIAGTLFRIEKAEQAKILDSTPQSLAYRLMEPQKKLKRALLIGEVGGTNIWLARRFGTEQITVLQPADILIDSFRQGLHEKGGEIFMSKGIETISTPARLYVERASRKFNIIHIASAEGMPAGSSGLQSLHEDYLLTREGIHACLHRVEDGGFVSATRGIQSPPRDNIKISAMFLDALRDCGVKRPGQHLLQARNYLAVTTLVSISPIRQEVIDRFCRECRRLGMDVEYYPGIHSNDVTQRHRIQGPTGKDYSYYHHAVMSMVEGNGEEFFDSWVYNVRPPTDQKPYFHNFFKWSSFGKFIDTYGAGFLRRMELGYIVLVLTFAEICIVAFILILLPLWAGRRQQAEGQFTVSHVHAKGWRLPVLLHFGGIGFGFMLLEMVMIQKLAHFLGDPIYSASAVITSILVCAGIGSSLQDRLPWPARTRIRGAAGLVVLLSLGGLLFLDPLLDLFIGYAIGIRFIISLAVLAPLAFCMGWMLPSGMQMVRGDVPDLIPWAWGINGFTSVAAGPLAVMLSIAIGFQGVIMCAAGFYIVAGLTSRLWPGEK